MGSSQGLGQGREFRIRRLLKALTGYDAVIVDTSPVLTPLNVAILYAVAEILIPIDPCIAALAGVRALEDLVRTVSEFRMEFTDAGPFDDRRGPDHPRGSDPGLQADRSRGPELLRPPRVYPRVVPASVKFREAYARGIPLVNYDRFSPGAAAYRAAAAAYLNREVNPV